MTGSCGRLAVTRARIRSTFATSDAGGSIVSLGLYEQTKNGLAPAQAPEVLCCHPLPIPFILSSLVYSMEGAKGASKTNTFSFKVIDKCN